MPGKFRVQVDGIRELKRNVRDSGDPLIAEPMNDMLEEVGKIAEQAGRAAAPVGATRQTRDTMRHAVSGVRPMATWVKVETLARKKSRRYPGGYRYPRVIEYGPKSRRKRWLWKAIESVQPKIDLLLTGAARIVELRWRF